MIYLMIDIMSGAVIALPLTWLFLAYCKTLSRGRFLWASLFTLYLCAMFDRVGIPAIQYCTWHPAVNLIPFTDEKNLRFFLQVGLNAVLFLPFGFLLPVLWRKCRTWKTTVAAGFLTSLGIEILQLFCYRATDVDDLIMNTLGTFLGYIIAWACFHKKWMEDRGTETCTINAWASLVISILIPLLVIIFVRTLVCGWIYSMPLFD